MLLEKIAIFILFLGPLVFFHELGHFLFARLFGVRVEVFSIGFGPKLFKKKYGDTEYAISAIPLGGYVKMYGDDPFTKDEIPESERGYSFTHKGKFARFWIVMGGPLANFILAFVIFFTLLVSGERIPEIKMGSIPAESILYKAGLRTGDVLYKVNDTEVYNPTDLMVEGKNEISAITVKRAENTVVLPVDFRGDKFFEEVLKHPPFLRKPFLIDAKSRRYVLSFEKDKVNLKDSIEEMASKANVQKAYLYPILPDQDIASDDLKVDLATGIEITLAFTDLKSMLVSLEKNGFRTIDLMVRSVNMKSPADKVGIREDDVFISLEGEKVYSFEDLRGRLQTYDKKEVTVEIMSKGELKKLTVSPDVSQQEGKTVRLLGVYSFIEVQKTNFVHTKSKGLFGSTKFAVIRTWDSVKKTIDGFVKLITNQISLKTIGGPLAIGKVAHDSFNTSLSYFFQLMALISVNLGVINLFPIPVLDGGHILFIALEIINGGPLSRRKMEIAQQVGLSVLLMLMVGAIFNDVSRFF
ncbi:MAG: RIP metalloprotease RseP [Alphaproteobacteria bacterium]|nr:MAG: RIP metalloprotease RseP [Alphaproteobacteria bacterium]